MSFKRRFAAGLIVFLAICGAISSARAEPFKIVGFGDSLMAGFGLGPGQGFTDKLQAALRARGH
ncbi:MAG: arylesterase, partial [Mesorhizobium sp.]